MSVGLILGQRCWWCSKTATGSITPRLGPLDAAFRLLLPLFVVVPAASQKVQYFLPVSYFGLSLKPKVSSYLKIFFCATTTKTTTTTTKAKRKTSTPTSARS